MRPLCASILVALISVSVRVTGVEPDFRLPDVNAQSNRAGTMVSPRDYLLQVSGYYFGDAG